MLLAVGLVVVVSLVVPSGRHQWAESLVRQPQPYSSLAFADPTALPTEVAHGKAVTFTFTIASHQSRNLVYPYFLKSSPSKIKGFGGSFGGGSVAVPAGQSRRVRVHADPKCARSQCRISVALVGNGEVIDFNVRVTGSKSVAGQS